MSPWHSSSASPEGVEPSVLKAVGRALGARPAVYTEGENGRGPALGKESQVRILKQDARDLDEDVDADESDADDAASAPRRPTTLHAKAYLAIGKRAATLWFGSANCTTPALLRPASGQGNVELLVRIALGKSGVAKFEADLASKFDESKGVMTPKPRARDPDAAWQHPVGLRLTLGRTTANDVRLGRALADETNPPRREISKA